MTTKQRKRRETSDEGREQVGGNFGSSASRHGNSPVSSIGKSMRSAANFPRKSSSRSCRKFAGLRPRSDQTSRKGRGGIPMPILGTSWKSRMVRSWKDSAEFLEGHSQAGLQMDSEKLASIRSANDSRASGDQTGSSAESVLIRDISGKKSSSAPDASYPPLRRRHLCHPWPHDSLELN